MTKHPNPAADACSFLRASAHSVRASSGQLRGLRLSSPQAAPFLPAHLERALDALGVVAPRPPARPAPACLAGPVWDGKGECPF